MRIGIIQSVGHDNRTIGGKKRIGAWWRQDSPNHAVEVIANEPAVDHPLYQHGGSAAGWIGRTTQFEFVERLWVGGESARRIVLLKVSLDFLNILGDLAKKGRDLFRGAVNQRHYKARPSTPESRVQWSLRVGLETRQSLCCVVVSL